MSSLLSVVVEIYTRVELNDMLGHLCKTTIYMNRNIFARILSHSKCTPYMFQCHHKTSSLNLRNITILHNMAVPYIETYYVMQCAKLSITSYYYEE
jgi:hypothetical protein